MYYFWNWSYNENKTITQENFMNFTAVAIVFAIVLGHSFSQRVDIWLALIAFLFALITVSRPSSTGQNRNILLDFPRNFTENKAIGKTENKYQNKEKQAGERYTQWAALLSEDEAKVLSLF